MGKVPRLRAPRRLLPAVVVDRVHVGNDGAACWYLIAAKLLVCRQVPRDDGDHGILPQGLLHAAQRHIDQQGSGPARHRRSCLLWRQQS